jgi:hypothetical protein
VREVNSPTADDVVTPRLVEAVDEPLGVDRDSETELPVPLARLPVDVIEADTDEDPEPEIKLIEEVPGDEADDKEGEIS